MINCEEGLFKLHFLLSSFISNTFEHFNITFESFQTFFLTFTWVSPLLATLANILE